MLRRFNSLINVVCLLIAAITSLAAMPCKALAEPPATVPARVIRELDGRYTIEYRPTSDGLPVTDSVDRPESTLAFTRLESGELVAGLERNWKFNTNKITAYEETPCIEYQNDHWNVVKMETIISGHGAPIPIAGLNAARKPDVTMQYFDRPKAARNALPRGPQGPVLFVRDPQFPFPAMYDGCIERVRTRLNSFLSPSTATTTIRLKYDTTIADPGSTQISFISKLYTQVRSAVFGMAIQNAETLERPLYSNFPTGAFYNYHYGPAPPGGTFGTTNTVSVDAAIRNVVLLETIPAAQWAICSIRSAPGTVWDVDRSDAITLGQYDFETALMHECLHALGFGTRPESLVATSNRASYLDLYRVAAGNSAIGLFAGATRLVGTSPLPFLATQPGLEFPMESEGPQYDAQHWRDQVYGSPAMVGIMNPMILPGVMSMQVLYNSDIRALDVLGYNIADTIVSQLPGTPPSLFPNSIASTQTTSPILQWGASAGNGYVVRVYTSSNRTQSSMVYDSVVLNTTSLQLPIVLNPNTQYWWTVTSESLLGESATSPVATFLVGTVQVCDSLDFNNDSVSPDSLDFEDYISVFGGGPCSNDPNCGDLDFNNDGVSPDSGDVEALLRVMSGGSC